MDNLEKILANLPKPKLRLKADLKIKSQLYYLIFLNRVIKLIGNLRPQSYILRNSLIVALLIIIIFSGASIYAYSSSNVAPGSRLYLLKRAVEKAEQQVSFTPAAKSQTFQKFSQRRLEEALRLSRRKSAVGQISNADDKQASVNIQKSIEEAVNNLAAAANTAAAIKNQAEARTVKNQITEHAGSETKYLNEIAAFADSDNDQEIMNKVREAKTVLSQYQNVPPKKPKEKSQSQIINRAASEAEPVKQIKQNRKNEEGDSKHIYSPRQRRERKTNNNNGGQKPSAQIQGEKINRDSEARFVQTATSSQIIERQEEPEPKKDEAEIQINEQTKPVEEQSAPPQPAPINSQTTQPNQERTNNTEREEETKPSTSAATSTPPRLDSGRESDRESDDDHEENYRMTATTTPERYTATTTTSRDRDRD